MVKAYLAVFAYLTIGGILSGVAMADLAKKCGGDISHVDPGGYAVSAVLWPATSATGIITAISGTKFVSTCKFEPRKGA